MKKGLPLWRIMLCGQLLIFCGLSVAFAQNRTVKGKVTDASSGEVMPGVNITIKGTSKGTTADSNGEFSIVLEEKESALVFSFIGYKPVEREVSSATTTLQIALESDALSLQEIVVVGYGTQKKAHLTGAVASTNMENLQRVPTGDALNAMQGHVAGVNVYNATGSPGSSPVVQVRGLGTINGSAPLYVIDGIPSDATYINPAEIESINVLKDASAATIYGSRGANGVILITTKKGSSGLTQVTFNSFVGIHQINNAIDPVTKVQKNKILRDAYNNAGIAPPTYAIDDSQYADTRWTDEYFKTGIEQKYDLSISGGTEQMTYSFSGGYYSNNGTVINTGFNRYNTRLNLEFKNLLNNRLKFNTGLAYNRKDMKNYNEPLGEYNAGYSSIMTLYTILPHKKIYDATSPNGFAGQDPALGLLGAGNIIGEQTLNRYNSQNDYLQLNMGADLNILKWLTYQFKLGVNSENLYDDTFLPAYNFGPGATVETPRVWQYRARINSAILNNLLNITKDFGQHSITILLGQASERYETRSVGGSNLEMPSSLLEALDAGIGTRNAYGTLVENRLLSYFGRASYNFADKYFLEASVRRDGSSRFGPQNRWGTFYGASAGWAIHRENFFNVDAVTELKPRYSYGVVGNQNISDFLYLSLIGTGGSTLNYPFGKSASQAVSTGASSVTLPTPDIKWEQTTTQNIGLDLSLLESLAFTFDFFKSNTEGMLVERRLPGSSGVLYSPVTNGATLKNKGFEVSMTYKKQSGDFTYNISANLGSSRNTVTKLGYEDQEFVDGFVEYNNYATTRTIVGSQVGAFYLKEVAGIFQSQEEIDAYVDKDGNPMQPNAQPGDFKFADVNNDGQLNDDDRKFFGSALPKASYGVNFNASWKNFDFALMFNGTVGNKMFNGFKMQRYRQLSAPDLLDSWTPANSGSDIPRLDYTDPNSNYSTASSYFLEDASYLRLRNAQIGYTLPSALSEKGGFKKLRIYTGGYNLLTVTKYTGFDPGLTNYGKFSRGVDRGYYPVTRSFVVGVSMTF
ncbi:MAG: SusC/RagA family TonB-linked outer membrane protein [Bacteroidota bacterium]